MADIVQFALPADPRRRLILGGATMAFAALPACRRAPHPAPQAALRDAAIAIDRIAARYHGAAAEAGPGLGPLPIAHARGIAADKRAHVAALGGGEAALPAAAPITFAGDAAYLRGAIAVEARAEAAYRALIASAPLDETIARNLADTIYHHGLVRTLLARQAAA